MENLFEVPKRNPINFAFEGLTFNDTQDIEKEIAKRVGRGPDDFYTGQFNWPIGVDEPKYHIVFGYTHATRHCKVLVRTWKD